MFNKNIIHLLLLNKKGNYYISLININFSNYFYKFICSSGSSGSEVVFAR